MFPILISAPSPTLFYVRDDTDTFEIDLDEINDGTYNPLKLHRVSFFLDVGLEGGSPMGFGFDGSMLIPRTASVSTPDLAIDCFNRVKACMMLGGLAVDATTQSMIGFGELKETGYFRYHRSLGAEAQISQALQEGGAGGQISICLLEPRRVTGEQVKNAYSKGSRIFGLLTKLNSAFLTLSYSSLSKSETRNALVFGWVACEQIVESFWLDVFLKDKSKYGSSDRRNRLKRNQNVALKLDLLLQAELISEKVYKSLSVARQARNTFAHTGGPVSFEDALECLVGLLLLIQEFAELNDVPTGTEHLLDMFSHGDQDKDSHEDGVAKAEDVDWERVKFWRPLYPIPGDERWEGDDNMTDGIRLGDATKM